MKICFYSRNKKLLLKVLVKYSNLLNQSLIVLESTTYTS